ncbi:hypothetical protein [Rhodomicrobium sp.]|uniref:hypothetical protein n=1 Tax=Rhodomicrobium sp. TaxID=2720632 RepID=UPI0039E40699
MIRFNAWPIVSLFLAGIVLSGCLFLFALHAGGIDGIGLTTAMARQHAQIETGISEGGSAPVAALSENARGDFQTYTLGAREAPRPVLLALPGEPALEAVSAE